MRQIFEQKKGVHYYATLRKKGKNFEVIIVPDKAIAFKKGELDDVSEALEVEDIFSDARKGERASDLEQYFGTEDVRTIAKEIIKEGTLQLTAEYRKKLQENKKKEIIDIIARNGIDPRNNLPIPPQRIELALDKVRVNINPFKSAKEQVGEIVDALRPVLPIKFEEKIVEGSVPAKYGGKISYVLRKYGEIKSSKWNSDGSFSFTISIPAGIQNEFLNEINSLTHGNAIINMR